MDSIFEICITCKFSDFALRSLLSSGGPIIFYTSDDLMVLIRSPDS